MVQNFFTFLAPLRNEIMFKNSKPAPLRQKILATPLTPTTPYSLSIYVKIRAGNRINQFMLVKPNSS